MFDSDTQTPARDRCLAITLRALGTIDMLAFVAVVMPRAWIACTHEYAGLGDFPEAPVASYLARSASALYGFYGILLWYLAGDVARYRRLISFFARLAVALGAILLVIDCSERMPLWWTAVEGPSFAAAGILIMVVQGRRRNDE